MMDLLFYIGTVVIRISPLLLGIMIIIMLIASEIIGKLISAINNLEDQLKEKE